MIKIPWTEFVGPPGVTQLTKATKLECGERSATSQLKYQEPNKFPSAHCSNDGIAMKKERDYQNQISVGPREPSVRVLGLNSPPVDQIPGEPWQATPVLIVVHIVL